MNILHFVGFFNGGGTSKTCLEHVRHLENHNHIFIGSDNGSHKSDFKDLGYTYSVSRDDNFNYPPLLVNEILRKHDIDLVHMYLPGHENPTFLNSINLPKICTVLCGQQIGFSHKMFDHVRFISQFQKKLNKNIIPHLKDHSVIRCGLGPDRAKFRNPNPDTKTCFGRVSAFCPSKRVLDTLECAKVFPENMFLIAGHVLDIGYYKSVIGFIKSNSLENVRVNVNISDFDKEALYNEIDVLHYPTENEAFCFSILEGMQRTKAVVSYNNSSIPELNHKGTLSLAENLNIDDLVKKTAGYVEKPATIPNDALNNRAVYEEHYTSKKYSESMEFLYESFN